MQPDINCLSALNRTIFFWFLTHISYWRIFQHTCPSIVFGTNWFIFYSVWGWPHLVRPGTTCRACLTQHKLILDSKAFGLATENWPGTAGPAVPQFMSAWYNAKIFSGGSKSIEGLITLIDNLFTMKPSFNIFRTNVFWKVLVTHIR